MADLKTKPTRKSVAEFLEAIADEKRRHECHTVMGWMKEITGNEPKMWGDSMVGFGEYHYNYASGREGDWFITGFSPRSQNLTLYIMSGFAEYEPMLERLGKHKKGKSCLYIKRLEDIDTEVLKELIRKSVEHMRRTYG